jgi:adenosylcobinamide-phosphate synthase
MLSAPVFSLANPALIAVALILEAAFGYPDRLYRTIRHPVVWAGALIAWLDRTLNTPPRGRIAGAAALAVLLLAVGVPSWALQAWLLTLLPRWLAVLVLGVLAAGLLAQRSLFAHVRAVETELRRGLDEGRAAVSHIVGRNPASLDATGVARAAIESLAENFSDGVVAPMLWGVGFGLPGIALYKAINTADSMIGHRRLRPAGIGGPMLAGADARAAWRAVWRDAGKHRSPNAGWPEAAMAGALGLRLAGPRIYGNERVEDAWMGDGRVAVDADDIARALRMYRLACGIGIAAVIATAGFWSLLSPR